MNRLVLWTGRLLAAILTILSAFELWSTGGVAVDTRMVIICVVAIVFTILALWQVFISWRRDGWPRMPPSFRWVMAVFLSSFAIFTVWSALVVLFGIFRRDVSIVMWWQLGMSSLYFFIRWINLGGPREAGVGETGTAS